MAKKRAPKRTASKPKRERNPEPTKTPTSGKKVTAPAHVVPPPVAVVDRASMVNRLRERSAAMQSIAAMNLSPVEMDKQLRVQQMAVMRLVFQAQRAELLEHLVDEVGENLLLVSWQRLTRLLEERFPGLPRQHEISDAQVAGAYGQDVHLVPPERMIAWVNYSAEMVRVLVDMLKPSQTSANFHAATPLAATSPFSFDADGSLDCRGNPTLSQYLIATCENAERFIRRLDSCARSPVGDYLTSDPNAGPLPGLRIMWENLELLANASMSRVAGIGALGNDDALRSAGDGVVLLSVKSPRNDQDLTDALRQLLFLLPRDRNSRWVDRVTRETASKLRSLANRITEYTSKVILYEAGFERDAVTDAGSVNADLVAIAAEFRRLSTLDTSDADKLRQGGRLIERAMKRGAFAAPDWIGTQVALEERLSLTEEKNGADPYVSASMELFFRVRRHRSLSTDASVTMIASAENFTLASHAIVLSGEPRADPPEARANTPPGGKHTGHADDFTWVMWFGTKHTFSKGNQAECVRHLWESWMLSGRQDGCGLSEKTLGVKVDSANENFRVLQVFRKHPALGTMIRRTDQRGVYALFSPISENHNS